MRFVVVRSVLKSAIQEAFQGGYANFDYAVQAEDNFKTAVAILLIFTWIKVYFIRFTFLLIKLFIFAGLSANGGRNLMKMS